LHLPKSRYHYGVRYSRNALGEVPVKDKQRTEKEGEKSLSQVQVVCDDWETAGELDKKRLGQKCSSKKGLARPMNSSCAKVIH
jgi:hypothetical protein